MKVIKIQLFYVLLLIMGVADSFAAELSTKRMVSIIRPVEQYAMQYGEGDIKAYVFVDPKCPHSRDFISMIHDNEKMRKIYHYYIFFYELKRFNSHKLIGTIYASSSPLQKMLEVMAGGKEIEPLSSLSPQIEEEISDIEHVATALGVNKRPYLIIAKEWN